LKNYPNFPYAVSFGNVSKLNNFIYSVGGGVDANWRNSTNQVPRLNLKKLQLGWQKVASTDEERSHIGAAVYNGCLVVASGSNNKEVKLHTTELYQPSLMNKWISFGPLTERKSVLSLVAIDERLFVIGGSDSVLNCLSLMQQLCNMDEKWNGVKS